MYQRINFALTSRSLRNPDEAVYIALCACFDFTAFADLMLKRSLLLPEESVLLMRSLRSFEYFNFIDKCENNAMIELHGKTG